MAIETSACPGEAFLTSFLAQRVDAASTEQIRAHLTLCAECRRRAVAIKSQTAGPGRKDGAEDGAAEPVAERLADGESHLASHSATLADGKSRRPTRAKAVASFAPPHELAHLHDYELLDELGRGGMGVVYLARQRVMDRLEVLKVLNQGMLDRPDALARFHQEIRAAAALRHPNIVAAHCVFHVGALLVFAMEYVPGQDLAKIVRRRGPLPTANSISYAQQAAWGLEHAFERGMVHRDIKPNNLILAQETKKQIVKILDFGLAKATCDKPSDAGLTLTGQMLGTPDYMAPEQTLDAQRADIRADIYSLGCTLYFLLAGKPPFAGASLYELLRAHHSDHAPPLDALRTDVSAELAALVAKMMAKDPAKRFQTPAEVARALSLLMKQRPADPLVAKLDDGAIGARVPPLAPPPLAFDAASKLAVGSPYWPVPPPLPRTRDQSSQVRSKIERTPIPQPKRVRRRSTFFLMAACLACMAMIAAAVKFAGRGRDGARERIGGPAERDFERTADLETGNPENANPKPSEPAQPPSTGAVPADSTPSGSSSVVPAPIPPSADRTAAADAMDGAGPQEQQSPQEKQKIWAKRLRMEVTTSNSIGISLVLVPPGEFLMGSTDEQIARAREYAGAAGLKPDSWQSTQLRSESPQHAVILAKPFLLGRTEVTIRQFQAFVDATRYVTKAEQAATKADQPRDANGKPAENSTPIDWRHPGYVITDDSPVTVVTWNDAAAFCNWLSEREGLTAAYQQDGDNWTFLGAANGYRMPTEAEWEYACRAGSTADFTGGDDPSDAASYGWIGAGSGPIPHAVGIKRPNAFGICDMHGNVLEWCSDWYDQDAYFRATFKNPTGPGLGSAKAARGGFSGVPPFMCRSAFRVHHHPVNCRHQNLGFRVLRELAVAEK